MGIYIWRYKLTLYFDFCLKINELFFSAEIVVHLFALVHAIDEPKQRFKFIIYAIRVKYQNISVALFFNDLMI